MLRCLSIYLIVSLFIVLKPTYAQYNYMNYMRVSDQKKLLIASISISGNKKTNNEYILRELPFQPEDSILLIDFESVIDLAKKQIINTGLFLNVDFVTKIKEDSLDVEIIVKERNYFFPSLVFELADDDFDIWWHEQMHDPERINYGAAISWRNLTGYNDHIVASFSSGFRKEFLIAYSHPAIDRKQRLGLSVSYSQQSNREIAYGVMHNQYSILKDDEFISTKRNLKIAVSYRKSLFTKHTFGISINRLQVADTILNLNPIYLPSTSDKAGYIETSYKFNYLNVDNRAYPLKGSALNFQIAKAGIFKSDNIKMASANIDIHYYSSIINHKLFSSSSIEAYLSGGAQLPFAKHAEVGKQTNLIRGYQYYNLLGTGILLIKQEIKCRVISKSISINFLPEKFRTVNLQFYPKIFADAGVIQNKMPETNFLLNKWLFSFGTGIDLVSYYDSVLSAEFVAGPYIKPGFYLRWQIRSF